MCKKSGIFNSKRVLTYRTGTFTKKAYRTNVPYPFHYRKSVPYQRTVFLSKNGGGPYRTYVPTVPYRTAILAHHMSHIQTAYKVPFPYLHNKRVPHFLAKIEAHRTAQLFSSLVMVNFLSLCIFL